MGHRAELRGRESPPAVGTHPSVKGAQWRPARPIRSIPMLSSGRRTARCDGYDGKGGHPRVLASRAPTVAFPFPRRAGSVAAPGDKNRWREGSSLGARSVAKQGTFARGSSLCRCAAPQPLWGVLPRELGKDYHVLANQTSVCPHWGAAAATRVQSASNLETVSRCLAGRGGGPPSEI